MRSYLVVDDNAAFADNLAEILSDFGDAQVKVAHSGADAIALAGAQRFDAVISDMRMPKMNGAELMHELRRVDPGLPAIVITAYTGDDLLEAARRQGLLAVLPKPAPMTLLLELVTQARRDGLVALVDDDAALADNLSEALRSRGFAAITAHTVLDAERLGVRPFTALVDLRLPGGRDGEAMRRLATRFPGLPMFVITGHADATPPLPAEAQFVKPFATASLIAAVEGAWAARHG